VSTTTGWLYPRESATGVGVIAGVLDSGGGWVTPIQNAKTAMVNAAKARIWRCDMATP
jgi:hypothetical protein